MADKRASKAIKGKGATVNEAIAAGRDLIAWSTRAVAFLERVEAGEALDEGDCAARVRQAWLAAHGQSDRSHAAMRVFVNATIRSMSRAIEPYPRGIWPSDPGERDCEERQRAAFLASRVEAEIVMAYPELAPHVDRQTIIAALRAHWNKSGRGKRATVKLPLALDRVHEALGIDASSPDDMARSARRRK